MEESLSSCESHLQEKIKEVNKLQLEVINKYIHLQIRVQGSHALPTCPTPITFPTPSQLENLLGKHKVAMSKSSVMQKEMSKLSETKGELEGELRDMKKQQKSDTETISALRKELVQKKNNSASSQEKVWFSSYYSEHLQSLLINIQNVYRQKKCTCKIRNCRR